MRRGVALVALATPMCDTTDEARTPGYLQTLDGVIDRKVLNDLTTGSSPT